MINLVLWQIELQTIIISMSQPFDIHNKSKRMAIQNVDKIHKNECKRIKRPK